jgi:hypothetical protein
MQHCDRRPFASQPCVHVSHVAMFQHAAGTASHASHIRTACCNVAAAGQHTMQSHPLEQQPCCSVASCCSQYCTSVPMNQCSVVVAQACVALDSTALPAGLSQFAAPAVPPCSSVPCYQRVSKTAPNGRPHRGTFAHTYPSDSRLGPGSSSSYIIYWFLVLSPFMPDIHQPSRQPAQRANSRTRRN